MESELSVPRRRRTRAEVQQILAEFLSSGMNQDEFCRSRGVCRSTLCRYLRNQPRQQKPAPAAQLVSVELVDVGRSTFNRCAGLAVVVGNGRRIEVGQGFDAVTLERLLAVLDQG
jgi:hypothetical protein